MFELLAKNCSRILKFSMIIKVFSKLFDVLIHVRGKHIALTGDIENAFLMIGIHESDRDMLRFLWINDPQ